ncbi:MAG TPA: hypothetical protein VGJ09_01875, partial [Bryobacteraceae bacterium]
MVFQRLFQIGHGKTRIYGEERLLRIDCFYRYIRAAAFTDSQSQNPQHGYCFLTTGNPDHPGSAGHAFDGAGLRHIALQQNQILVWFGVFSTRILITLHDYVPRQEGENLFRRDFLANSRHPQEGAKWSGNGYLGRRGCGGLCLADCCLRGSRRRGAKTQAGKHNRGKQGYGSSCQRLPADMKQIGVHSH